MRRRWRGLGCAAAALAAMTAISGCVTLPHSSSVDQGRGAGLRVGGKEPIRYQPPPPRRGQSRGGIVRGYLQAMLANPQDPALVRTFLTPTASEAWQPGQLLVVYANPQIEPAADGAIHVSAQQLGSLDERGSWVSSTNPENGLDVTLELEKVDGQWRINNPPAGTLLDTDTFDRYYHQYALYFYDPARSILAPDPVYERLGSNADLATSLVRNLLLGPTRAMAGVVSGVAPPRTQLNPRVTVSRSGLADVRLTRQVTALSPLQRELFGAELSWTLRQRRLGISRIKMTVNGRSLLVPGFGPTFPTQEAFSSADPSGFPASQDLFALAGGKLNSITPIGPVSGAYQVQGPMGPPHGRARSVGVSVDGTRAAYVVHDGTHVVVGAINPGLAQHASTWFDNGHDFLKPSWDAHRALWLVDRTAHGAVIRVATSRGVHRIVDAPGIANQDVRGFAVSRDGMRFAAILGQGDNSELVIAMVRRTASSDLPAQLVAAKIVKNVLFPFQSLTSVSWYSPTVLAVLAEVEGSEPQPYQISIDGSRVQPTTGFLPVLPVSLTAGARLDVPLVVGTEEGALYVRAPNQQWPLLTTSPPLLLFAPTYPG